MRPACGYLLTHAGWQAVWTAATTVGWGGFALLCLATLLVFLIMGPAWYVLLPASFGLRVWPFISPAGPPLFVNLAGLRPLP